MVDYNEIKEVYKLLICKRCVSHKDFKSNNISAATIKYMLSLQMIEKVSNTFIINPQYQIKDLAKLYEITQDCNSKDKELFLRFLYDLNYISYDFYLELLNMAFKKKDYDLLFDVIDKLILNYKGNSSRQDGITSVLYELSFITKIPPIYHDRIKKNIILDKVDESLFKFRGIILENKKALINKRNNSIKRLLLNNEFQSLRAFLETESEKVTNLGLIYDLINYVNDAILMLFKGNKVRILRFSKIDIASLIYSNNFNLALKLYGIMQSKLSISSDNLKLILEKVILISKMMSSIEYNDLEHVADLISDDFNIDKASLLFNLSLEDKTIVTLQVIKKALINRNASLAESLLSRPYILSADNASLMVKRLLTEINTLKDEVAAKKLILEDNK